MAGSILIAAFTLAGCKKDYKEPPASDPVNSKGDYMIFNSKEKLRRCIEDLTSDNLSNATAILQRYQAPVGFQSLYNSKQAPMQSNARTEQANTVITSYNGQDLVPDQYFASILNDKLEVQVENTVYKVTKYGTFMCMPGKLARVNEIIHEMDKKDGADLNQRTPSTENGPVPAGNERRPVRQVEPGIVIMSGNGGNQRPVRGDTTNTGGGGGGVRPPRTPRNPADNDPEENEPAGGYVRPDRPVGGSTTPPPLPTPLAPAVYDGLPTYEFDAQTWAGQLIQDVFGRTKPHFEYFDNTHRVKVNFYNVNFGVYAAAGVNVKMQTKGWTGIWRKLETEELRLGWDGLTLKFKIPNMPQPPIPKVDFGKLKLGNINLDVESISVAGISLTQKAQQALHGALEGQYRNGVKYLWDYVTNALAPAQFSNQKQYVQAFKAVYKDEVVIALGRYEESVKNTNEITKTFDWNVGITIKWNPDGGAVNLGDFQGAAYSYEISGASVYGLSQYYGVWKGARVDKK
ncbi:hypothetical protein CK934_07030 [Chitinophaga sp. MD30]|nr:hypothetical protein CK934_07030 [Chitinophaga sp. MD30]